MTTIDQFDRRNFKAFQNSDDEELQLSWIKGLFDQINFANRPDVLPHFRSQFKDSPEVSGMSSGSGREEICRKCGITPLYFDPNQRNEKDILIPLEVATKQLHQCSNSMHFRCMYGGQALYLDKKILSPSGRLNFQQKIIIIALKNNVQLRNYAISKNGGYSKIDGN